MIERTTEQLETAIDETRITYEDTGYGVRIHGGPFACEFESEVDPIEFYKTIGSVDDPWKLFAIKHPSDNGGKYVKIAGVFQPNGTKIDLEIWSSAFRVYVREDAPESRVAKFLEAVDDVYGIDLKFPADN